MDQELFHIFNNCNQLETISVKFPTFNRYSLPIDGDKILMALNKTLPQRLSTISFGGNITISDESLGNLMNNWKGPKPININIACDDVCNLLEKYQNLGFLKYKYYNLDGNGKGFQLIKP